MDFKAFNDWKNKAFQTKTEQEYKQWQEDFRAWYGQNEWNDWEKNLIKEQLTKLNEQKEAYFSKLKQHPVIQRNNFILREEEGQAFARLCNALADALERQPRFATVDTPIIDFQGEGGGSVHPQGENASEGTKTTQAK